MCISKLKSNSLTATSSVVGLRQLVNKDVNLISKELVLSLHVIDEVVCLLVAISTCSLGLSHFLIWFGFLIGVLFNVLVDGLDNALILFCILSSESLIHSKADNLEVSLLLEEVKNLEVLFIESCLSFVSIHSHFWHVFLICLIYLSHERGSEEGKETVAGQPNHCYQKKHKHFNSCVISKSV